MKLISKLLGSLVFALVKAGAPLGLFVLRKSPRLQSLVISALQGNDLFRRVIGQVASLDQHFDKTVSPLRANAWVDFLNSKKMPGVTVVIPIHNAFESIKLCLESLSATLGSEMAEVLLVDDASTDTRVIELLETYALLDGYTLVRNRENLGYTRSVNLAFDLTQDSDVVLLNSDTVVTHGWLSRLTYAAYSQARVASATAISNNAGAFSMFNFSMDGMSFAQLNEIGQRFAQISEGRLLEVPTGNGFCIFIRRDALREIGYYDAVKYPRGYGEENDFAMRALRLGWKSVVCDKAIVFHSESQSFGHEKKDLIRRGLDQLNSDYPEYKLLTQRFWDPEFTHVRHQIESQSAIALARPYRKRILFVMPITGGGLPETNQDLMEGLEPEYESFVLKCHGTQMSLFKKSTTTQLEVIWTGELSRPIEPLTHHSEEYDKVFSNLLFQHSIDVVHVEHLAWQSLGLASVTKALKIPLFFTVHDYYSICPSHNLIDDKGNYCGGTCGPSRGQCAVDLWPAGKLPVLKAGFISRWQTLNESFLEACTGIFVPSEAAGSVLKKKYMTISSKVRVVPHERFIETTNYTPKVVPGEKIRVLVLGNIGESKGAKVIESICQSKFANSLEFHFLGDTWPILRNFGIHHGTYKRDDVVSKIVAIQPHVGLLVSIWAETFSHTLTELVAAGVPSVAFDLGAISERTRAMKTGIVIDPALSSMEIVSEIERFVGNTQKYGEVVSNIQNLAEKELRRQSPFAMAKNYIENYAQK